MSEERLDPYTEAFNAIAEAIAEAASEPIGEVRLLLRPPKPEYGDLAFPLMRYSRKTGLSLGELAGEVERALKARGYDWVRLEVSGGYVNFRVDERELASRLAKLMAAGWRIRVPSSDEPRTIVVEHTSANPIHPLHIGHGRNSSIGDTLSRMLAARGHRVNRRFYVDDSGRQVAVTVYGFKILGVDPLEEARMLGLKPDHYVGWVYAVTHTILDAVDLRERLREASGDEAEALRRKLDDALASLADLKARGPVDQFEKIVEYVTNQSDNEEEIRRLMKAYEDGEEEAVRLFRMIVNAVLEGFRETLSRLDVGFDAWDYESEMVWNGLVAEVLEKARRSPYYTIYKGAEAIDIPRVIRELVLPDPEARKAFRIPKGFDIPPMILTRSDGTALYTTKDVAYSIYKFRVTGADKVINVIGASQKLPQLQVRLTLLAIGHRREALNMIHYDYEIVRLPGVAMKGRRGRYVTLDDLLDSLRARAEEEVRKRNPDAPREWVEETAEAIAIGALRFALVRTSAPRPITFNVEKALDLQENSGPYLQYTHARAHGILAKHGPIDYESLDPIACSEARRRSLLVNALRYPLTAAKAADDMAPEDLASYLLDLADEFNSWYQVDTVIREPDVGARECKAMLVALVKDVLGHGLRLLGVPPLERM